MVIIQAILAAIFRSAGKILNTAFGWATVMLFGKVPENRQIYLSVVAFGSVLWLIVLLGVIFPWFAVWLLSFVKLPHWVDRTWIRIAMIVLAVILPGVVGIVSLFMLDPSSRPKGVMGKLKAVLKGYPYTLGLALTLILMTVFAPFLKVRNVLKRWTSEHIPVIIEGSKYLNVVDEVEKALRSSGTEVTREPASWMLRLPTRILSFFAGSAVQNLVADQLTNLKAKDLEVLVHPSDIVVSSRERDAARGRAILAEQLAFSDAHLTWTKEANEVEDRLRHLWHDIKNGAGQNGGLDRLHEIDHQLHHLKLSYEEWDTLFREELLVERGLLAVKAGIADKPQDTTPAHGGHAA